MSTVVSGQTVRGAEIIAAIKRSGISTIVALPDIVTSDTCCGRSRATRNCA